MSLESNILKEHYTYCKDTGLFFHAKSKLNGASIGDIAGTKVKGYISISINGKRYKAHKLAWLYEFGRFPDNIDHINGNKSDNRIENLREVSHADNMRNRKKPVNNKSGTIGVFYRKDTNKWRAVIVIDGVKVSLGSFSKLEDAIEVRKEAEIKYGYHINHGRDK